MLQCPSDFLFFLCIYALSPWYSTALVPECSYMLDFWLCSSCVLPMTADSNLDQAPCSLCIILSTHMAYCKYSFFVPARYGDFDPSTGPTLNYFRYSRASLFLRLVMFHFWVLLRTLFVNFEMFPLSIIVIWRCLFLLHSTLLFVHRL